MADMKVFVPVNPLAVDSERREDFIPSYVCLPWPQLGTYLTAWESMRQNIYRRDFMAHPERFLSQNFAPNIDYQPDTLEPFLRRPGIGVDACSKLGNDPAYARDAFWTGMLIALYGFNINYGGGNSGLMGKVKDGFIFARDMLANPRLTHEEKILFAGMVETGFLANKLYKLETPPKPKDPLAFLSHIRDQMNLAGLQLCGKQADFLPKEGYEDQFAVQVFPACFSGFCEKINANDLTASNEGLCNTADAALMTTNGMINRTADLITMPDGVISCPGSHGTTHEITQELVGQKTGRIDKPLFLLNTRGFYNHFGVHTLAIATEGLDKPESVALVNIVETPLDAICGVVKALRNKGIEAQRTYHTRRQELAAYVQRYNAA